MKKYQTSKVFTPTTPAELTFVERDEINEQIVSALRQPGKQIVVYGHSGSGKTTLLLNKLNQLYENHVTSRCSESITVEKLILDAFDKLNRYYTNEFSSKKGWKIGTEIGAEYTHIKSKLTGEFSSEKENKSQRIVPPQLTIQRLAEFLGAAKCCWVIEDFHKVRVDEKKELAQSIKIFMDTASDYPEVKVIAIGAVGTARDVVAYDREMQNRVAEIHVSLMNKNQLMEIMDKGQQLLNVKIGSDVQNRIVDLANGLGAVCHQLCLNMCNSIGIYETPDKIQYLNENHLNDAVQQYINEQSDTFKATFDNAVKVKRKGGKYNNCKLILSALSHFEEEYANHSEILSEIHKLDSTYPASNLTTYLKLLTSTEKEEILRYDEKSSKYSFSNPFLKVYSRMMLEKKSQFRISGNIGHVIIGDSNIIIHNVHQIGNFNQVNIIGNDNIPIEEDLLDLTLELDYLLKIINHKAQIENYREIVEVISDAKIAFRQGDKIRGFRILSKVVDSIIDIAKTYELKQVIKALELPTK
jgi:energy-coupling factor transporter ATP-binding protein EcfA2